jgi:histidinol dehydrogenase
VTEIVWSATGSLAALPASARAALTERASPDAGALRDTVSAIIQRVREHGDAALIAYAREFDGLDLSSLEVPRPTWDAALARIDPAVRDGLVHAERNIAAVHAAFAPASGECTTPDGVRIGRRVDPLDLVGVYAPGGRAAYPSSVLMGVVPARIAGVREIIVCSPPRSDGSPEDVVLAAAAVGGAHRVFAIGGAGAIAAMAHGTASVPRVDRIVGPGNAFVAEAKMQVANAVGIDLPAGPSELLVLADDSASPAHVAVELIAQAEHDPRAAVVAVGTHARWVEALRIEVERQVDSQPKAAIVREALRSRGAALVARDIDEAIAFANGYAAEHVLLTVRNPYAWLARLRNAGTVFLGAAPSVAFGDYMTGANHVLPTGGLARSYSGLSPLDFVRWTTYQIIDRGAAARLAPHTEALALAEGLPAHAAAARHWRA